MNNKNAPFLRGVGLLIGSCFQSAAFLTALSQTETLRNPDGSGLSLVKAIKEFFADIRRKLITSEAVRQGKGKSCILFEVSGAIPILNI
jgi:hypothetical protein